MLDQLDSQVSVAERRRQEAEAEAKQLEDVKVMMAQWNRISNNRIFTAEARGRGPGFGGGEGGDDHADGAGGVWDGEVSPR